MFPFIYRRQTVQAEPGPRRVPRKWAAVVEKNHLHVEDEVLTCRRAAGQPAQAEWLAGRPARQMVRWADGQMDLEARRWALLNLGFKGAIEMPLLIVHLAQDHVVLQEEFVSHAKSRKKNQEKRGLSVRSQPGPGGGTRMGGGDADELAPGTSQRYREQATASLSITLSIPCSLGC